MKKLNFKYLILSVLSIVVMYATARAQETFKINAPASKLLVSGTSSIHDWEMKASGFSCEASIQMDENSVASITAVNFSCPVEGIKSDNKIMDGKTHKALNSAKYPEIKFQFAKGNTVNVSGQKSNLKGDLIIAGQKKEVDMIFSIVGENQNEIMVKGEVPLKMSDFGIEPPTAMMGTLKTGDEVLIKYELTLQKTQKIN